MSSPSIFAGAISRAEGYGVPGAIPTLANNPGDLALGDLGQGTMGQGITVFGSAEEGWQALEGQLSKITGGSSAYYSPDMSISQMGQIWAGGDPNWANNVSKSLGADPSSAIGNYLPGGQNESGQQATPFFAGGYTSPTPGGATPGVTSNWDSGSGNSIWARVAAGLVGLICIGGGIMMFRQTQTVIQTVAGAAKKAAVLAAALLLILAASSSAQNTTMVTATITDSDGQAWVNGTWTATLYNPSGTQRPVYTNNGQMVVTLIQGQVMDSTGKLTYAVPDNNKITPIGTRWDFTLCSNTSAACVTTPNHVLVTGSSQDLSSNLSGQVQALPPGAPRFAPGGNAKGYADNEVTSPTQGSQYYNVLNLVRREFNGTTWSNVNAGNNATILSSVNKVLNVMAPPYNAKCDALVVGNIPITAGVTSGYSFTSNDVGKQLNGMDTFVNGATAYSGKILSVSGGNATLDNTATTNIYYGVLGTNDAAAIQAAFNDGLSKGQTIQFPAGGCLTDTIVYNGQSFFGASNYLTSIYGMPGRDIFQTPDIPTSFITNAYVHDLRLFPDITVDASATVAGGNNTFPNRIAGTYKGTTQYLTPPATGPLAIRGSFTFTLAAASTAVSINGNGTTNLTLINRSRSINAPINIYGAGAASPVTGYSIAGNVATLQCVNTFTLNQQIVLSGFPSPSTFLNSADPYTITSVTGSQFTVALNAPHANVASSSDAGNASVTYTGTITGIGTNVNNVQAITVSPAIITAIPNAHGNLLNPPSTPWYIGNAAFALQCSNSDACAQNVNSWKFQNIVVAPISGGTFMQYNHVAAFFHQLASAAGIYDNIGVSYLYAGYVEAAPPTGARVLTPDQWTGKDLNFAGCQLNMVLFNGNDRVINQLTILGSAGAQSLGLYQLGSYNGTQQGGQLFNYVSISGYYYEAAGSMSGELGRFMGGPTINAFNETTQGGYLLVQGSGGRYVGNMGTVQVTGNDNTFIGTNFASNSITDTGQTNTFEATYGSAPSPSYQAARFNPSHRPYRDLSGKLDASFLVSGNSGLAYQNATDFFSTCDDWAVAWNVANVGTWGTCVYDPTVSEITSIFYHSASATLRFDMAPAGSQAQQLWNTRQRTYGLASTGLPYNLASSIVPMTKAIVYIRARCVGAATCTTTAQMKSWDSNGNQATIGPVSPTLTFTNQWTTQSFLTDLSGAVPGTTAYFNTANWANTGSSYDVLFWGIQPQRTDPLYINGNVVPTVIAGGSAAMTTAAVNTLSCGTVVSPAATSGSLANVIATDTLRWSYATQPGSTTAGLILNQWTGAGVVSFEYCNPGAASITPSAQTINWQVVR